MSESVKRMDNIINSLVSWMTEFPTYTLTKIQKTRIEHLLERLKNSEAVSHGEILNYQSNEYLELQESKRQREIFSPNYSRKKVAEPLQSFICEGCNARVLARNKKLHRKKCEKWKNLHKTLEPKIKTPQSSKGTSKTNDLPGKTYKESNNDLKNQDNLNRKHDGGRDYFQIRDNGKFGSISSFDDYGDESNP